MAIKKNADLLTETAVVLLNAIKESAQSYGNPAGLRDLAEAYALISQNEQPVAGSTGRGGSF